MQLLNPLTVEIIRFATGHILDMARIDQKHSQAARFEDLKDRDPVHARGLHRDNLDAAGA